MAAPGWKRRLSRLAALLFGVGAIAGVALAFALPRLVEWRLLDRLAAAGVEDVELVVRRVGWASAKVGDVRVGTAGELTIFTIDVEYAMSELFAGRVPRIVVSGLRLRATAGADGLSLGALDALLEPIAAAPPSLAIETIELREAELQLMTPAGAVTVTASAEITVADGQRVHALADVTIDGARGSLAGSLTLDAYPGGRIEGSLRVTDGRVSLGPIEANRLSGDVAVSASGLALDTLEVRLSFAEVVLPRVTFNGVNVGIELADGRLSADVSGRSSDGHIAIAARGTVDGIGEAEPKFALEGEVTVADPSALENVVPGSQPATGRGRVAATISGSLPPEPGELASTFATRKGLEALAAEGTIEFALDDVTVPGVAAGLRVDGRASLELSAGALSVTTRSGIRIGAARPDPRLLEAFGVTSAFGGALDGGVALQLGGTGRTPFFFYARAREETFMVHLAGGVRLALSNDVRIDGELDATAEFDAGGAVYRFTAPRLDLAARGFKLGQTALTVEELRLNLAGTPESFGGGLGLRLTAAAAELPGVVAKDLEFAFDGDLAFGERRVSVTAREGGVLRAAEVRLEALSETYESVELSLERSPGPILEANFGAADGVDLRYRLALTMPDFERAVELPGGQSAAVLVDAPRLRVAGGARWPEADYDGTVVLAAGGLRVPAYELALEGIDVTVRAGAAENAGSTMAVFAVRDLRSTAEPAFVVPLRLDGRLDYAGDRVSVSARIADLNGRMALELAGGHDLAANTGRAALKFDRLTFASEALQPHDLFPALRGMVAEVSGTVAAQGEITWSEADVTTDLTLLVDDVSLRSGRVRLERVNSVLRFDQLWPPSTPPGQIVAVGLLDAGLPLTDGVMSFRLLPEGRVEVERAEWHWAGGTIRTEPFTVDPAASDYELVLEVADLDLAAIAELVGIDGLSATGRLGGRLPVAVGDDGVSIRGGQLEATPEGGLLRFSPTDVPAALLAAGEAATLTLTALKNFRYETLRMTLDRQADGDAVVGVHIRGSNPAFYDGFPVEFNLNISGELDAVLRRSLVGYRVPDAIRERLQKFGF